MIRRIVWRAGLVWVGAVGLLTSPPEVRAQPSPDDVAPRVVPEGRPRRPRYFLGLVDSRTINLGGFDRQRGGPYLALEVLDVVPGSPAQVAGLEAGDVILGANQVRIRDPEDLRWMIATSRGDLLLRVRDVRTGRVIPVGVTLGGRLSWPPVPGPTPGGPIVVRGRWTFPVVGLFDLANGSVATAGRAWEVDVQGPRLQALARALNGRVVEVSGTLEVRRGIEDPRPRRVIIADGLRAVDAWPGDRPLDPAPSSPPVPPAPRPGPLPRRPPGTTNPVAPPLPVPELVPPSDAPAIGLPKDAEEVR